jgi:hypothetical protein
MTPDHRLQTAGGLNVSAARTKKLVSDQSYFAMVARLDQKGFWTGPQMLREDEVERIAKDIGVSASELRRFATLGPDSADLLLRRMAALDLDRNEVSWTEPRTYRDLRRVCSMCNARRRCTRDLARDSADRAWQDYCPNAATLMALNARPWRARAEW